MQVGTLVPKRAESSAVSVKMRGGRTAQRESRSELLQQNMQAILVTRLVAIYTNTDAAEIMSDSRGKAKTAQARQIIAYLLHTALSMSLSQIAEFFSRDRTTIGHACRLVEDLRDKPEFESGIADLEETIRLVRELANHDQ